MIVGLPCDALCIVGPPSNIYVNKFLMFNFICQCEYVSTDICNDDTANDAHSIRRCSFELE